MIKILLVGCGGILGAVTRYAVNVYISNRIYSLFPWATFSINMVGSFLLGLFLIIFHEDNFILFIGTGFLGSFTTLSTFSYEGIQLLKKEKIKLFIAYVLGSFMMGIIFAYAGIITGKFIIESFK